MSTAAVAGRHPPGPRGLPVLGMLLAIRRNPTAVFMDAARRFGDMAYLKIGPRRGYLLTNPADVRHVLQDNAANYRKSPLYDKLRQSLGNGLVTSEGDFWLRQRRIAQPAFHRSRIARFGSVMAGCAADLVRSWEDRARTGQAFDLVPELLKVTLAILGRSMFGGDLSHHAEEIGRAVEIG